MNSMQHVLHERSPINIDGLPLARVDIGSSAVRLARVSHGRSVKNVGILAWFLMATSTLLTALVALGIEAGTCRMLLSDSSLDEMPEVSHAC